MKTPRKGRVYCMRIKNFMHGHAWSHQHIKVGIEGQTAYMMLLSTSTLEK